jgi:hypothetical protein
MKQTWLYKKLDEVQNDSLGSDFHNKTTTIASLMNIIVFPILGVTALLAPLLFILTFFLGIFKDLYDVYLYLNAEKIAKKEAVKKALKLKNNIKNWIDYYQTRLDNITPYMLEKITYEEKPKVEQLPGVDVSYQGGILQGIFISDPLSFSKFSSNRYKSYLNTNIIKEKLSKEFINLKNSKFEDFILQFFIQYNNECNTIHASHSKIICDTNRRRSLHDIYLITKYYYPEVTFIDIIKTILSLLKIGVICSSYCSTVNKYVFYTTNISHYNSFKHTLEFTNELTFNDLKQYIENEQ